MVMRMQWFRGWYVDTIVIFWENKQSESSLKDFVAVITKEVIRSKTALIEMWTLLVTSFSRMNIYALELIEFECLEMPTPRLSGGLSSLRAPTRYKKQKIISEIFGTLVSHGNLYDHLRWDEVWCGTSQHRSIKKHKANRKRRLANMYLPSRGCGHGVSRAKQGESSVEFSLVRVYEIRG